MDKKRYIIGVAVAVVIAIIAIFAIVSRPRSAPDTSGVPGAPTAVDLADYADKNSSVQYTTQGEIVGQNEFQAIRVSISPTERRVEVLSGYEATVTSSQSFPNTPTAYATFLQALKQAGYTKKQESLVTDFRGVCPLGRRYIYTVTEPGNTALDSWSTTCGRKTGTFAGNSSLVRQLFQAQIPDYSRQVKDVKL